jgi:hypothetical protein
VMGPDRLRHRTRSVFSLTAGTRLVNQEVAAAAIKGARTLAQLVEKFNVHPPIGSRPGKHSVSWWILRVLYPRISAICWTGGLP